MYRLERPDQAWGSPSLFVNQWLPDATVLEVKWLGCEDDHSPPSTFEVKNAWSFTSTVACLNAATINDI